MTKHEKLYQKIGGCRDIDLCKVIKDISLADVMIALFNTNNPDIYSICCNGTILNLSECDDEGQYIEYCIWDFVKPLHLQSDVVKDWLCKTLEIE